MNRLRDFFYNISDILVTLLIVAAALALISWRVDAIMNYGTSPDPVPQTEISQNDDSQEQDAENTDADSTENDQQTDPEPEGDDDSDNSESSDNTNSSDTPQNNAPEPGTSIRFTINSNESAYSIADKLQQAGLVADSDKFVQDVISAGADTRLKSGTFTIPAGATHAEIITIFTA